MSPAGDQQPPAEPFVSSVTCLGCGCACDDITVVVRDGRIAEARQACPLGVAWFGDGRVPALVRLDGREVSADAAIAAIATRLREARAPLIYLAPELSCEAQREAVALADSLNAAIDTVTCATALASVIAAQERGRAGATLGEVRNRADVLLFWGVDPGDQYPRYWSRYAPEPSGLHVEGRRGRTVIAVDVGDRRGPADADVRVTVPAGEEVATLTALDALLRQPATAIDGALWSRASDIAEPLTAGRYVVLVADGESTGPVANTARASALISVSQALNARTRAALSTLRAGGNRSGAEVVLTAQTGYPTGVTFASGYPAYRPFDLPPADVVLVIGAAAQVPAAVTEAWTAATVAVIGPRASEHTRATAAIDTGLPGVHYAGTAVRMDDVPLPLRQVIEGPPDPAAILKTLTRLTAGGGSEDPPLRSSNGASVGAGLETRPRAKRGER